MNFVEALHILINSHTKPDKASGFKVSTAKDKTRASEDDYHKAWTVLRREFNYEWEPKTNINFDNVTARQMPRRRNDNVLNVGTWDEAIRLLEQHKSNLYTEKQWKDIKERYLNSTIHGRTRIWPPSTW